MDDCEINDLLDEMTADDLDTQPNDLDKENEFVGMLTTYLLYNHDKLYSSFASSVIADVRIDTSHSSSTIFFFTRYILGTFFIL